jgi:hypothetical protein
LTAVAVLAGVAAGVGYATKARSADHLDSPAAVASPAADIADVYSWMDSTAANATLVMTVYPAAPTTAKFDTAVKYALHTSSGAFGNATNNVDIIATFDANQKISLWVGTDEYVTGDASSTSGLQSADGKVKVFAGLRADPFFFNLDGFKATVADVDNAEASLTFNDAGCPAINAGTSAVLVNQLKTAPDGGAPANFFAPLNALAIVVTLDKSLITKGGAIVSVWGGTYK